MANVSAASSNGGAAPEAAVSSASADHSRMARQPIRVAASEAGASVIGPYSLCRRARGEEGRSAGKSGRSQRVIDDFDLNDLRAAHRLVVARTQPIFLEHHPVAARLQS